MRFFDAEAQAKVIKSYQTQVITGLLQTEDYARTVISARPTSNLEELIANRMDRQAILARKTPPRLWLIVEESVIHRRLREPGVAKAQLQHLADRARSSNIVIQVVPHRTGIHAGLDGSYQLLTMEDGQEIAYVESRAGGQIIEDPVRVADMALAFDLLRADALSPTDSLTLIEETTERF